MRALRLHCSREARKPRLMKLWMNYLRPGFTIRLGHKIRGELLGDYYEDILKHDVVHRLLRPHVYFLTIVRIRLFSATAMHCIAAPGLYTPKNTNFPRTYTATTRLIAEAFPRQLPSHMRLKAQPVPDRYESHSVLEIPIIHLR